MKIVFLRRHALLFVVGIAVIATVAQVLRNDLVWDDVYLVSEIEASGSLGRLADIVGAPFWSNSSYISSDPVDYWRPLTKAVLWFGGLVFDKAPWGMHLLSLLAAIGASLAIARLVSRALAGGRPEARRVGLWMGLVFLAHPLCAEVLCLASNVSDHLALIFLAVEVAALHDYQAGRGGTLRLAVAAVAGFLACASKETGVVAALAPLAASLLHGASEDRPSIATLRRKGPWIAAVVPVAIYLALRTAVITGGGGSPNPFMSGTSPAAVAALGIGQVLLRAVYPAPQGTVVVLGPGSAFAITAAAVAWVLLAAKTVVDVVRVRRLSLASVGALFALVLFAPSMAAPLPLGEVQAVATRYLHLPLAGLLLAGAPLLVRRWGRTAELALAVAVALLCLLSWVRIGEWRTEVSFFSAELAYHPESEVARVNFAQALCQAHAFDAAEEVLRPLAGTDRRFTSRLAEAAYFNAAAKIALFKDRDVEAATRLLEEAARRSPEDLTNVLMLAEARDRAGRPDQSLIITEKALAAPWFQDHRRAVILKYLDLYRGRAAEAAKRKAP